MKKFYIPVLALLIAFANFGCEKKAENAATDSTTAAQQPGSKLIPGTASIMPPQAANQPILLTTQAGTNPDQVTFSAVFAGSQAQTVAIAGGPSAPFTLTPANPNCTQNAPAPGTNITVTPQDTAGCTYAKVNNIPPEPPGAQNISGSDVTTYTDTCGNSVTITITDTGRPAGAPVKK